MSKEEPSVTTIKRGTFGDTLYLDGLRDSMEYHGKEMIDKDFLSYVLSKEKKAFLLSGLQAPAVRKALANVAPWKDCHVSKSELPLHFKGWSANSSLPLSSIPSSIGFLCRGS